MPSARNRDKIRRMADVSLVFLGANSNRVISKQNQHNLLITSLHL